MAMHQKCMQSSLRYRLWSYGILLALCSLSYGEEPMRHVNKCNFCKKCHIGSTPPGTSSSSLRHLTAAPKAPKPPKPVDPLDDPSQPMHMRASAYLATFSDTVPKQKLPNCTECYGCTTQLSHMQSESRLLDRVYAHEKGATSSWLFRATTNKTKRGEAVAKLYCVPIAKRPGGKVPTCAPVTVLKNMRLLLAIQKVVDECGFNDIIPRVWVDRVDGVIPDLGYHIRWHGLWMEYVDGASLENVLHRGQPSRLPPSITLNLMHNKLNKTQVVLGAIFDLLTSQCDRHSQNIFIDETGKLTLIDNEACLQSNWKNCGFDSILVPGTQKQEIVRVSNEYVLKLVSPQQVRKGLADPQLLLDYRCYVEGGRLGTAYPFPKVTQCLKNIAAMSVKQVQEHYGLADELPAFNLHARAKAMIEKGFEWAWMYGQPRNAPPKRYRPQPPCCKVKWQDNAYQCAHEWKPKYELPIGDPTTGREWSKAGRKDTGTYEGGTFPGEIPE